MGSIRHRRVHQLCIEAITSICFSPVVESYNIGFTSQSAIKRGDQYRGVGYHSLVVLADKMTREEALRLEQDLCEAVQAFDTNSPLYKKFREGSSYRRSYGGAPSDIAERPIHSVYMAWWRSPVE
jgi:hypothetical protein